MTSARDRIVLVVGTMLLAGYLVQLAVGMSWAALAQLQASRDYKLVTGVVLVGYVWLQWMPGRRAFGPARALARHRLAGAFAPLVLYAHASRFGYGYLVWLAAAYLGCVVGGLVHRPVVALRRAWIFTLWFVAHVALAVIVVVLGAYHVAIALTYR